MKIKLLPHFSFLLITTLTLSTSIHTPAVNAQPATFNFDDTLKCIPEHCLQLPNDNRFRNSQITQRLINQLLKWDNICQRLTGQILCAVRKSYKFQNGTISLKIQGTEGVSTDIQFNSGISSQQALNIAKQSFNDGESFAKTERLKNRTVLYSYPIDDGGGEKFYLQETYLILNSRNQVNRIVSIFTNP
ncbi:PepSY domain-containing protein [Anabaenopsis tanganyikae CS-531]|uniref:PepSY domain-containing protein n=1 Tax=Anabaenopsis tanganyikae CS-531 TaxID=2785304 RepID=A0ABT6KGZ5_9CYAN|nr:PepSY domain-containing protein [Anabaenopsis tanganyikae]MDH6107156.1 PepSY domain-containing protein [Anabaenopsis tanganyikae CS-531]